MLHVLQPNISQRPRQKLADTGYRSKDNLDRLVNLPVELSVALGREGEPHTRPPHHHPHKAAIATQLQTPMEH